MGQERNIAKMKDWLLKFEKKDEDIARALLITGPCGVGKTIAARLLLQSYGYKIYEYSMNECMSGVVKGKKGTTKEGKAVLSTVGLNEVVSKLAVKSPAFGKFAILLDGVGSMKAGAKTGLSNLLSGKTHAAEFGMKDESKIWLCPIIITCEISEYSSFAVVSKNCFVTEFVAPTKQQLSALFVSVCLKEGIKFSTEAKDKLIDACGGDVRRLLHNLHFFNVGQENCIDQIPDVTKNLFANQHNMIAMMTEFLKCGRKERMETDFMSSHPVSLALLLQENYLAAYSQTKHLSESYVFDEDIPYKMKGLTVAGECELFGRLAATADFISESDLITHSVYDEFHWEIQETATVLTTVGLTLSLSHNKVKCIDNGNLVDNLKLNKSGFYSSDGRMNHRARLMASFSFIEERGLDFIDICCMIAEKVDFHAKGVIDKEFVRWLKDRKVSVLLRLVEWPQEGMVIKLFNFRSDRLIYKICGSRLM